MKTQIHLTSHSEAHRANALTIICRCGAWPGLLLAACCALLTGLAHPARAAVTEAWVHRYSNVVSNSDYETVKVVRDAAGDIIVAGYHDDGITGKDMLTIKYSGADGSVLWQKRYNGPANGDDEARAVAVDSSGNVVVAGYSDNGSGNSYQDRNYYTAKYAAADGALLWEEFGTTGLVSAVAVDVSGNVVVTGSSDSTSYITDYYTAKYAAADGALLWEQRYNGPANAFDGANAVAVDGSGNVVVTGSSYNTNGRADFYTAKYAAANGSLLWQKRYNGPADMDDYPTALALDGSGNVVVTGTSTRTSKAGAPNYNDYYTAKYAAADGALLWEKRGPSGNAQTVAVDAGGNVVVMGFSSNANGAPDYDNYYTAKYAAADGALLWEKRYNGTAHSSDYAYAVVVDGCGNVVVTGNSGTFKYAAADGTLLWEKRYDYAYAVVVDGSGNVVVTGRSTAKYAGADGALLWEKRYNGTVYSSAFARAVAVDGSGNVVVTGSPATIKYLADGTGAWTNAGGNALAVDGSGNVLVTGDSTAKYAAADGALLWEKRYTNFAFGATAVAVDGSGNVVVTGISYNGPPNYDSDYYTAKYAAADGALLWERSYDGPANSDDAARAVSVDGSGNVVVTGSSSGTNGYDYYTVMDYYTAKYAAADGALLWEKRYNGPADHSDRANAVAVDGSGNVVVTGTSEYDYYTAKYAAADGALLWEKRYHGRGHSFAQAVAVDGSGNVVVTGGTGYPLNGLDESLPDYYTAKYAAADGALLWEKRYHGGGYSFAQAVAVDGSGNVVVTGSSFKGLNESVPDFYTAKYAAADGVLLWEKLYNGPADGPDSPSSLALGPNGMVAITGSSDGNFGPGLTYDYATVVYRENLPPVAIEKVPTGIRLRFTGVPGRSYNIERAPAVTGPWTNLATPTAPPGGLIEYVDTNAPAVTAFYRTVQP